MSSSPEINPDPVPEPKAGLPLRLLAIVAVFVLVLLAVLMVDYQSKKDRRSIVKVRADLRSLAVAIETYYVDNMIYPAMAMGRHLQVAGEAIPEGYPYPRTFRRRGVDLLNTVTTPIAYISALPSDPFADRKGIPFLYYDAGRGWIMGSYGPDRDQRVGGDLDWAAGTLDIKDRDALVEQLYHRENYADIQALQSATDPRTGEAVTYDPTNGLHSPGDIWRTNQ